MFNVGDAVTLQIPGEYDNCSCEVCTVLLTGGYGIVMATPGLMAVFNIDKTIAYDAAFYYRFSGLKLFHRGTPDWEI